MNEVGVAPGVLTPGLVSVPTSHKAPPYPSPADVAALQRRVGGFVPVEHIGRIARMRRSVGFAARAHLAEAEGTTRDWVVMVTLTYSDGDDWRPKHISALLTNVREWCRARSISCRYVWVAELQARGAIHYHLALWLPTGTKLPMADTQGWWPHGATRTERARAAVPYLMKYLSKGSGAMRLPAGARMHGCGGMGSAFRRAARWLRLPGFVRARCDIFDDWRRAPGGGWLSPDGLLLPSEYRRRWLGDAYGLVRVADHGRPFTADGPFTWVTRAPLADRGGA